MSTRTERGEKVILPRLGPDEFWNTIRENYADEDPRKWKYLAMLALRENAGWPLDCIGAAFNHPKGHVSRCLEKIKREIRDRFDMCSDRLEFEEPFDQQPHPSMAGNASRFNSHDPDSSKPTGAGRSRNERKPRTENQTFSHPDRTV